MKDYIIRGTAANNQIRAFASTTRNLVEEVKNIHNTSPIATAALGRLMTAAGMMGTMMKGTKDLLTLQIKCDGPIKGLTVTADPNANVKGYVINPDVMLPPSDKGKLDVGKALGLGVLSVIRDMGLREPYIGQTHLVSGEIAEDLTYYFVTSDQVPSSVALGVLMNKDNTVKHAGGFIIQLMPNTDEEVIDRLQEKLSNIKPITQLLDEGKTPEDILEEILGDFGLEIMENTETKYSCNCSIERVTKAVASIGRKDIEEIIKEGKPIEVNCHFCGKNYVLEIDELGKML
ncbi:chaperone HSP33 [Clostridium bornimense]|uniref:33 kDa chaperonin n=1 Tax=Clostridium bornimense TaxID=1216932 RepID=W6RZE6_9CLOT|nr:Hsp33 family molecular chaperone HslO [Clostridium bornimense]CDM68974.1 chaperone HSP33 [Clostridium bornimense]